MAFTAPVLVGSIATRSLMEFKSLIGLPHTACCRYPFIHMSEGIQIKEQSFFFKKKKTQCQAQTPQILSTGGSGRRVREARNPTLFLGQTETCRARKKYFLEARGPFYLTL